MASNDERHDGDDALLGRWLKMKVPGFVKIIACNDVHFGCRGLHEIRIRYQLSGKDIRHSYVYKAGISGSSMFMFKLKHISMLDSLLDACKHNDVCVECIRMKDGRPALCSVQLFKQGMAREQMLVELDLDEAMQVVQESEKQHA